MSERQFRLARQWSNRQLREIGHLFSGDVVNVSGWLDEDKEGSSYRDYFPNARSYSVTNMSGYRGHQGGKREILLDLESDLPADLIGQFDIVLNHTTLEHIFDVQKAITNLCLLSRDVVIIVVPFMQVEHYGHDFLDYWRFTLPSLRRSYEANGLSVIYESANTSKNASIYVISVGSRYPGRWKDELPLFNASYPLGSNLGSTFLTRLLRQVKNHFFR